MYHLLALLEADAADAVACTATPAELAELQALHAELAGAPASSPSAFCSQRTLSPAPAGAGGHLLARADGDRPAQGGGS